MMPDEKWTAFTAVGQMSFTVDTETGETRLTGQEWGIVPEEPLLEFQYVAGLGLVLQSMALEGRIEFEGTIYRIQEIQPVLESKVLITRTVEGEPPKTEEYGFNHTARVFVEDVVARTDKMVGYIVNAVYAGGHYTIQNWKEVVDKTAPRWEMPLTAGSRFDREVLDDDDG